jgi:hypothetical protein
MVKVQRHLPYSLGAVSCMLAGCAPSWHAGSNVTLSHSLQRAVVYDDSLSLQGRVNPLVSFTDYGLKVHRLQDDTGRSLNFRSFQVFWAKELRFEAEFDSPSPAAKQLSVDIEFVSRSGRQRLQSLLDIERNVPTDYRTHLGSWREARLIQR